MRLYTKPYVTSQELKDSIPLDGCIHNYDSAYHIIFTNVKTIQQFSPRTGGSLPPANNVAELGMECAAAHIASRLLRGGGLGAGIFCGGRQQTAPCLSRAHVF